MTKRETQLLKELREIKERLAEIEKHLAAPVVIPYPVYVPPWQPAWPSWVPYQPPVITWGTGTTAISTGSFPNPNITSSFVDAGALADFPVTLT